MDGCTNYEEISELGPTLKNAGYSIPETLQRTAFNTNLIPVIYALKLSAYSNFTSYWWEDNIKADVELKKMLWECEAGFSVWGRPALKFRVKERGEFFFNSSSKRRSWKTLARTSSGYSRALHCRLPGGNFCELCSLSQRTTSWAVAAEDRVCSAGKGKTDFLSGATVA